MAAISLTQIADSVNFTTPGRGAEQWHGANVVDLSPFMTLDKYYRFMWYEFETAKDQYNFTALENHIKEVIDRGGKLGFGIMTVFSDGDSNRRINYGDGSYSVYPAYLHALMQGESIKDWKTGEGSWIPNWNSEFYLTRLLALHQRMNTFLENTSYKGVKYKDAISYIDIRGYGQWGEWNTVNIVDQQSQYPTGTRPTIATYKRIVDAHTQGFPNIPLVAMIAALDAGSSHFGNMDNPPEIAYYVLTQRNNWGEIGWRRDQWGATDSYIGAMLENNTSSFNGVQLKTLIMNKWKNAMIVGEPSGSPYNNMSDLLRQIKLYHATSFGNGNYGINSNSTLAANVRASALAAGYRITISSGDLSYDSSLGKLTVTLNWLNKGIAPTYENWNVVFEVKSQGWSGTSSFKPKLFLPGTITPVVDTFTLPSFAPGTYQLSLKIVDPTGYRKPLAIAIAGQQADGSYNLGNFTVVNTTPIPNQPPIAYAGVDSTITLPTKSVQLTGTATDVDGTVTSMWSQISGPNTAQLSQITSPTAFADNLVEGLYTFRITATDNKGATSTDTVSVTVRPEPVVVKTIESVLITFSDGSTQLTK
jgi:hypothetical protein